MVDKTFLSFPVSLYNSSLFPLNLIFLGLRDLSREVFGVDGEGVRLNLASGGDDLDLTRETPGDGVVTDGDPYLGLRDLPGEVL